MMLLGLWFALIPNSLTDSQEPRPIVGRTEVAKRKPKMEEVDAKRYAAAGPWLPLDIVAYDLSIEPFSGWKRKQPTVTSGEKSEKFSVGILYLQPRPLREMGCRSLIVEQIISRPERRLPTSAVIFGPGLRRGDTTSLNAS